MFSGGLSLNDCHAEVTENSSTYLCYWSVLANHDLSIILKFHLLMKVIVRRCLVSWFYSQLETVLKGEKEQSVLEKDDEGGFRVRAGVSFHLFISTAPCGDAR